MTKDYPPDAVKSILLQSTCRLYFSTLENTPFSGGQMVEYLVEKQNLSEDDAAIVTKHLFTKMKAPR